MTMNRMRRTRARRASAALLALISTGLLSGCQVLPTIDVEPWAVAHHDEKIAFHEDAGEALLNLDATAGFAKLQQFQAVGFHHVKSPNWRVHLEYQSSVDGEGFVSKFASNKSGYSFDQSHQAGSGETYYLLGDQLKKQASNGKSWVMVPAGDLGRSQDSQKVCQLFAVAFSCNLIEAWNITREQNNAVPVKLALSETGEQHFTTAVSLAALDEAGLSIRADETQGFDVATASETLMPFHVWVNADGIVTKMEVNGIAVGANNEEIAVQVGFELTATSASAELQPVDPAKIPEKDLYRITSRQQLDDFITRLRGA